MDLHPVRINMRAQFGANSIVRIVKRLVLADQIKVELHLVYARLELPDFN